VIGVLVSVFVPWAFGVRVEVGGTEVAVFVAIEGSIVSVALVGFAFVTPFPVVNAPAGMVLVTLPITLEVTSIATVQEPCAGTVPPLSDKLVPPGTAVTVPPHKLVALTGFAIVIPAGKLSTHDASVNRNEFGLKIVTLSREIPPDVMEVGEKLLFSSAGELTTIVAVVVGDGVNVTV
jgi:hypothetical protein